MFVRLVGPSVRATRALLTVYKLLRQIQLASGDVSPDESGNVHGDSVVFCLG